MKNWGFIFVRIHRMGNFGENKRYEEVEFKLISRLLGLKLTVRTKMPLHGSYFLNDPWPLIFIRPGIREWIPQQTVLHGRGAPTG